MIHIFLPMHNEEKTIDLIIPRLLKWVDNCHFDITLWPINDNSIDDTYIKLKQYFKTDQIINNPEYPGKGSALFYGFFRYCHLMRCDDIVIFLDGDGQINEDDIRIGLELMKLYDADVAIGNKRHPYSICKYNFLRSFVSRTYNFMVRILFDLKFQDTQCGLKIFKAHVLEYALAKVRCRGFAFDVELLNHLQNYGYRIIDFPVRIRKQLNSGSVNIKNIIKTFCETIKIFIDK